ncbi:MAG TPA: phosphoribosylformylglycinamidine synthase [Cyclobacteriaceae bacterium]|nr:phosphoribosylformylglycinamidine synthase [Cyclobacteriaceae bacterium]
MILFFQSPGNSFYAVDSPAGLSKKDLEKLEWLFGGKNLLKTFLDGLFIGPRKEMITPWSTNAVEITQNMGIPGIRRIEEFFPSGGDMKFDRMLQAMYSSLDQGIFSITHSPEPVVFITDLKAYNSDHGLALNNEEIEYLEDVSRKLGRKLTDSEVFGFSQVNSEHCRHKIFNGVFIIDGQKFDDSLFSLIRKTTSLNPNRVVSAYKDNVAFIGGPEIEQFAPVRQDIPDYFSVRKVESVISLKAETHNFPTTVEPFYGASTGSGGEIRDRMAGGKGSIPLAGTAVYITSYPRLGDGRPWESLSRTRNWLYQSPLDILIKASNGASDFGNKFGQPLLCGSLLTFEYQKNHVFYGYDKVIMLAGGIGFGIRPQSTKDKPVGGENIIMLGGDNYRIGMGGGAVSSVATGEYNNAIELNAVQRANPEMQKRVFNAIRAMVESDRNPIISVHDHGAGGHLNCFAELVEEKGGVIFIDLLPIGDPTLSAREIIGNESQERMGLVIGKEDMETLKKVADRERAPFYSVGEVTGNQKFRFENRNTGEKPIDWNIEYLFGNPPKTIISDKTVPAGFQELNYDIGRFKDYLEQVLQIEAVACKDWLTNKVDRSVTGKIARQQTCGKIQLPLRNLAVVTIDNPGPKGIATSIGHAPIAGIIDPAAGSRLSVAEALTNIIWAPLEYGLEGISLSANWMWPSKNQGEDARLYEAVKSISDFVIGLGINIPTGKDSLSMTQKYPDGLTVMAPGTVIVSAVAEVSDIAKAVDPVAVITGGNDLIYVDFWDGTFELGGSSFSQVLGNIGNKVARSGDTEYFKRAFNTVQQLIREGLILAGHDVSSGGLITSLLEMIFTDNESGLEIDLSGIPEKDPVRILFSEMPGIIIQGSDKDKVSGILAQNRVRHYEIGGINNSGQVKIVHDRFVFSSPKQALRDNWYKTSWLLDTHQTKKPYAGKRYENYKKHTLDFIFPKNFTGKHSQYGIEKTRQLGSGLKAAIIREKGVNGDREMAWSMHLAGFDVKDVHMTDLINGHESLDDIQFIVFVGGFSNSDVLGSAKGWAGAFLFNKKAQETLNRFYERQDTLSLGVCNGCQLMVELGLIYPQANPRPRMQVNCTGKFESAFIAVDVLPNHAVMLSSLAGSRLGIWVAHGEGRFELSLPENQYHIPAKFHYSDFPGNPNGSDYNAACIASMDGRHLAIMPHLERSIYPWNWAYYPDNRKNDEISPWVEAFVNARKWVAERR